MLGHGSQGVSKEALRTRFVSIPRAGHLSMLAAPATVARAIDEFAARARS